MNKIRDQFEKFFQVHKNFQDCKIEIIKVGHNSTTYLITDTKGNKLIAKKGKKSKDLGSSSLVDVRTQSFLNAMKCDFVPKIIYWDNSLELYVESYLGDEAIKTSELNDKQLDIFAKQLTFIHSLTAEQYQKFSKNNGFEVPQISSFADNLKIYGFDRFEIVKKLCPDNEVKNWIKSNLNQNLTLVQEPLSTTAHLKWGDIGENLRKSGTKLYFIGWEFSKLGFGSELAYIKIHSHLSDKKFNYLLSRYSEYSGRTKEDLLNEIKISEKITRTNDVVWAAMKWGQSKSAKDLEKYKELTFKRIALAEEINK